MFVDKKNQIDHAVRPNFGHDWCREENKQGLPLETVVWKLALTKW